MASKTTPPPQASSRSPKVSPSAGAATTPSPAGAAVPIPAVAPPSTYQVFEHLKQIKIPKLGASNDMATFRTYSYNLQSYLQAHELLEVFNQTTFDRPSILSGDTQAQINEWNRKDVHIHQILLTGLVGNAKANSMITSGEISLWRKQWSRVKEFFMPEGDLALLSENDKFRSMYRYTNESMKDFINRVDIQCATLESLGETIDESFLKQLYLKNIESEFKPMVLMHIDNKKTSNRIRKSIIDLVPHLTTSTLNNNASKPYPQINFVQSSRGNRGRGGRGGRPFKSNSIYGKKPSMNDARFNNMGRNGRAQNMYGNRGGRGNNRSQYRGNNQEKLRDSNGELVKCHRCQLFGHYAKTCSTDLTKYCDHCNIFGHHIKECRKLKSANNVSTLPGNTIPFSQQQSSNEQQGPFQSGPPRGMQVFSYHTNSTSASPQAHNIKFENSTPFQG